MPGELRTSTLLRYEEGLTPATTGKGSGRTGSGSVAVLREQPVHQPFDQAAFCLLRRMEPLLQPSTAYLGARMTSYAVHHQRP